MATPQSIRYLNKVQALNAMFRGGGMSRSDLARRLVAIANALRALKDRDLEEAASTRLLVYAALLIKDGMDPVAACRVGIVESLTDDADVAEGLMEVVAATFGR